MVLHALNSRLGAKLLTQFMITISVDFFTSETNPVIQEACELLIFPIPGIL